MPQPTFAWVDGYEQGYKTGYAEGHEAGYRAAVKEISRDPKLTDTVRPYYLLIAIICFAAGLPFLLGLVFTFIHSR